MKDIFAKVKGCLSQGGKKARVAMAAMLALALSALPVSADASALETAVSGALTTVQTDATSMITTVLPYALAIAGVIVVVTIGWRVFKRIAGR